MPGQTYGYRWYVDQPLRTIYFHDHQDPNSHQQKGLFAALNIQPAKATWHDPKTGAETDGTGTVADIHFPDATDPTKMQGFRELMVFHQDRAPMWKDNGTGPAIDPPGAIDDYGADQGGMALNYRNEPFPIRVKPGAAGAKGDPAYVYSSAVHGDPSTDVWRAYSKDPVVIRNMVGSHEEMHTFNLHGHRWLNEPDNPKSAQIDSQSLAIAEWFNYDVRGGTLQKRNLPQSQTVANLNAAGAMNGAPQIVEGGAGAPGDYLYGSQRRDDKWLGCGASSGCRPRASVICSRCRTTRRPGRGTRGR